jgi:uncharacterized YigZ family protein
MNAPSGADRASGAGYRAPTNRSQAELRERGSRFLGLLVPVADAQEAAAALKDIRKQYPGATHHCWAWRLGAASLERSSDDGEPSGTAGVPILRTLRGAELSDALVVVVRWFGGTKLGKGGLARAYAGACSAALESAAVVLRVEKACLRVALPYDRLGAVKHLAEAPGRRICSEDYGEQVVLVIEVDLPTLGVVEAALADLGPRLEVERLIDC